MVKLRAAHWVAALVVALLGCSNTESIRQKDTNTMSDSPIPSVELDRAARLATDFLKTTDKDPALYRLVFAENQLAGGDASSVKWRLGYKLRELIPDAPVGKIGKGGDFYLAVDLAEGTVSWAKGGH